MGFDPSTLRLTIGSRWFELNNENVFQYSQDSLYAPLISLIPTTVAATARLLKIQSIGSRNLPQYLNFALLYGGFTIGIYDGAARLISKFQITIYLDGHNTLSVSELFDNTFFIGVFDKANDRIVISIFKKGQLQLEVATFDFSSLPDNLFIKGQARSVNLSVDETTEELFIIVLCKTSPLVKIRFIPSSL